MNKRERIELKHKFLFEGDTRLVRHQTHRSSGRHDEH